jgi:hypothetical protein
VSDHFEKRYYRIAFEAYLSMLFGMVDEEVASSYARYSLQARLSRVAKWCEPAIFAGRMFMAPPLSASPCVSPSPVYVSLLLCLQNKQRDASVYASFGKSIAGRCKTSQGMSPYNESPKLREEVDRDGARTPAMHCGHFEHIMNLKRGPQLLKTTIERESRRAQPSSISSSRSTGLPPALLRVPPNPRLLLIFFHPL